MKVLRSLAFTVAVLVAWIAVAADAPLRVLIITGANNHDWKSTTAALRKIYEDSGRFKVDVTEKPTELTAAELAKYDVLVNNWTMVGKAGHVWGVEVEKAIEDFVAGGKGFLAFHAGSSCFYDWPGFHKIVGGTWGKGTGHGRYHSFKVSIVDLEHPITKGLKDFEMADELWHRIAVLEPTPGRKVLCKALAAKDQGGTGEMEDVVVCSEFGKGRGVYVTLGHDAKALESPGCRQLMLRGTEWAATGKVAD
jgi:type 1 glutamine amidotransferase